MIPLLCLLSSMSLVPWLLSLSKIMLADVCAFKPADADAIVIVHGPAHQEGITAVIGHSCYCCLFIISLLIVRSTVD